jgi:hypothetical protein
MTQQPHVLLVMPFYAQMHAGAVASWEGSTVEGSTCEHCGVHSPKIKVTKMISGNSFLAHNFNTLWSIGLNRREKAGFTHFAMIHSDVKVITPGWLDVLVAEMERTEADWLSVVLPIKDWDGITSTAVEDVKTGQVRRLTVTEVQQCPVSTFDAADLGLPDHRILGSTGLWLVDFRQAWVEKVWFEVRNRIIKTPQGFVPQVAPDDWLFCRWLHRLRCRLLSTKIVKTRHIGECEFPNDEAWGNKVRDEETDSMNWVDGSAWGEVG